MSNITETLAGQISLWKRPLQIVTRREIALSSLVGLAGLGLFWGFRQWQATTRYECQLVQEHGTASFLKCTRRWLILIRRISIHQITYPIHRYWWTSCPYLLRPSFPGFLSSETFASIRFYTWSWRTDQPVWTYTEVFLSSGRCSRYRSPRMWSIFPDRSSIRTLHDWCPRRSRTENYWR